MPRKAFNADVEAASQKSFPGVTSVRKGDDDGDVTFAFAPVSGAQIEIGLLALGNPRSSPSPFHSETALVIMA
jgi:ubiquitin-conjugating enzyme E2 Q